MTHSHSISAHRVLLTAFLAAVVFIAFTPNPALAEGRGDGAYGRFDHGLVLSIGAGIDMPMQGTFRPAPSGELRARLFNAVGPYLSLRGGNHSATLLVAGIELRPLFPALFLLNMSTGHPWVDVFIQSLSVELGIAWFAAADRAGLAVGLALEIPLALPGSGVFDGIGLRLSARHVYAPGEIQGATFATSQSEWSLLASLTVHLGLPFSAPYAGPSEYHPG